MSGVAPEKRKNGVKAGRPLRHGKGERPTGKKQGPGKKKQIPSRSCLFRFGDSHREGFGNHRLHIRIASGAGGVHHRASVAGVGSGVALDILDRRAATPDRHMVDDLFFRDVLAIADQTHFNHPFADILPYQIIGDRPQLK